MLRIFLFFIFTTLSAYSQVGEKNDAPEFLPDPLEPEEINSGFSNVDPALFPENTEEDVDAIEERVRQRIMDRNKWKKDRPDGVPPIGVDSDVIKKKGEVMLSYRYRFIFSKDLLNKSTSTTFSDVSGPNRIYDISSEKIFQHKHSLKAVFGTFGWMTVGVGLDFYQTYLETTEYDNRSSSFLLNNLATVGVGDMSFDLTFSVFTIRRHIFHITSRFGIPTGSINETYSVPTLEDTFKRPYIMQLGSGTFDYLLALMYQGQGKIFSWGSYANVKIPMTTNKAGYKKGIDFLVTAWVGVNLFKWMGMTFRVEGDFVNKIKGKDQGMPVKDGVFVSTLGAPKSTGYNKLNIALGFNFYVHRGPRWINGQYISMEVSMPAFEVVNAIQPDEKIRFMLGWKYPFFIGKKNG